MRYEIILHNLPSFVKRNYAKTVFVQKVYIFSMKTDRKYDILIENHQMR